MALLYGFFVIESRTETPLLPLRIITDFSRGLLYLASLLANAAQLSMFLFITYYFQSVLGYSAIKTRLAFLPFALAIIVAAVLSARPIANFGPLPVMLVGAALSVAALLAFSGISTDTSYVLGLMLPEILIAVGVGLSLFPLNNIVLQGIDPGDSGVAGALVSTTQQTGGSIGTALLNTIFTVSWPRRCRPSMDTAQCSSWRRRCMPAPLC